MTAARRARFAVTLGLALASPCAFALDPALDISQYAHKRWMVSDGFAKGITYSIAQTPDGYLWLGTEFGLLRFDGVRSTEWTPPSGEQLPSNDIRKLLVTRDGTLWIGTYKGLASWKSGRLKQYRELSGSIVSSLLEDGQGVVWAGATTLTAAKICAVQSGTVRCTGDDVRFGNGVPHFYEYRDSLWAGVATGLWRWKPDPPKVYTVPGTLPYINDLIEGDNGALWIAMRDGLRQFANEKVEAFSLPAGGQFNPYRLLRDRDGGLWIGTQGQGLLHVHQGRTDLFKAADGLSGDYIYSLFEDWEGNIWAGTPDGFDRFRAFAVSTISSKQGLSGPAVTSVLAARDGSLWLGTPDGVNRWNHGQITIYRKQRSSLLTRGAQPRPEREVYDDGLPDNSVESLFQDDRGLIWVSTHRGIAYFEDGRFLPAVSLLSPIVLSIVEESAGNLWLSEQNLGLFHLRSGKLVEQFPWAKLGRKDPAFAMAADPLQGGIWLGFLQSGLAYFKEGQIRKSYAAADGLGEGRVNDLRVDRGGALWAATDGGLSRFKNGRIATLTRKTGLPCDAAQWSIVDDAQSVWLMMPCGLVRIPGPELDAWAADPSHTIKASMFDSSEGVRSYSAGASSFSPHAATSADGKLWFTVFTGVSVVDPRHLPFNKLPPPVQIEQITADRKQYAAEAKLRLPPLVRELQIDYTALSFVAPEKVRFRYKLEGHDGDWEDVGNRRQAFYTDLPPRNYRFRVMAANNSGVWNEAGASLDLSITPAYYQTTWFLVSSIAAVLALLAALYQLRLRYLKHQFNIGLEARVGERTRIARDLHDTLLQSFQAVLLKFSTVKYVMRSRPDEAEETLERIIEEARAAVTEGRDAVQGLRSSTVLANDLARAITTFAEGIAADHAGQNCPEFRLLVEGKSRDLPPLVREEVYQIASESLRNAFRHAQAQRIEVEVRYDPRQFRLRVVDNGKGIDPAVLNAGGRAGHHGLPGLQERAQVAGGKLSVFSRLDSGTEIELTIPASIAYTKAKTPAAKTAGATDSGEITG